MNVASEWLVFLFPIWEVLLSNLGQATGCPDKFFVVSSFPKEKCPEIRPLWIPFISFSINSSLIILSFDVSYIVCVTGSVVI
jgi:hypothetical protein